MKGKAGVMGLGVLIASLMMLSSMGLTHITFVASGAGGRAVYNEMTDTDAVNNDDFTTAQVIETMVPGDYLAGTTGLGDTHRIDTYVIKNVAAGMVINASIRITNWNSGDNQALLGSGWNKYHVDNLAWSNREDNPDRRPWEAVTFLCVITGDYFIQLKPIAGVGTFQYELNARVFDPEDITSKIGAGGVFGPAIPGRVSSLKWYPGNWYKFQMAGEVNGMNEYLYVNVTEPGAPDQRLQGDPYVRNLEPESYSYWLNHSWWLDSYVQYEEMRAAATHEGMAWYYLDMQGYNTTGGRSENYEIRLSKTVIDSDGDNHPKIATKVTYELGKTTVRKTGMVVRGPDMMDWYQVYLQPHEGVSANLTLNQKSNAIFRLSIYRDNITATTPNKGYDLMSSWTNKPADAVLNRVNALTTNVTQEGWYYIAVIAQIGLTSNVSNLADWTVCTAWAQYNLDITLPDRTVPPEIQNPPSQIVMPEDGTDMTLKLNFTGSNNGVFSDKDFAPSNAWGEALTFSSSGAQNFQVIIANSTEDEEATVTLKPNKDWNGEADITFTATDLYGKSNSTVVHVRVTTVNDQPYVKARIPDFQVKESDYNLSMKDIDLFQVFADPDFAPFGDDNLTFSVDNTTFPATITESKLTFGQAPGFPGKENHVVVVTVTATDHSGDKIEQKINITVINLNRAPEYYEPNNTVEIYEDQVSYFDLNRLFTDPDGDPMNFAFLGGASDNLTVEISPNGSAILRPAPNYFTAQEILRFRAIDPLGANKSGELLVRIVNVNDPPYLLPGGMVPDPLEEIRMNEGEALTFRVSAADIDNKTSELKYTWFIDEVEKTKLGTAVFTWRPTFEDQGPHSIKVRISDGMAFIDADWNITVNDTNRAPLITEAWPQNNTEVSYGANVKFCATANDPDGDPVTFYWRLSDGTLLKTQSGVKTSSFSKVLSPGKQHIVVLEVQDGKGGVARQYIYVKVGAKTNDGNFIPGFETLAVGMTLLVAGLAVALMRRRK